MKALVTGLHGFTGRYLEQELVKNGYEVYGLTVEREREREAAGRTCVIMAPSCRR